LGAKQQAKNAQSWPQVFSALTPSVKRAPKVTQKNKKKKQKNIEKKKTPKFISKQTKKTLKKNNKVYPVFLEQGADYRLSIGHMICPSFLPFVHNSQI
jgi:hypothetical protein